MEIKEIEPTLNLVDLDGVPCRIWKAKLADGRPVDLFVHRVGGSGIEDFAEANGLLDRDDPSHLVYSGSIDGLDDLVLGGKVDIRKSRAERLRDQVLKTWEPPMEGFGKDGNAIATSPSAATPVQTAVVQTLCFVFGRSFATGLNEAQQKAVDEGLELFERTLTGLGENSPS